MAEFICTQCGKKFDTETKFCSECGGKVNAVLPPEFVCTQCGKTFDAETKFCSECGGKVADKNAAPAVAPAVAPAPVTAAPVAAATPAPAVTPAPAITPAPANTPAPGVAPASEAAANETPSSAPAANETPAAESAAAPKVKIGQIIGGICVVLTLLFFCFKGTIIKYTYEKMENPRAVSGIESMLDKGLLKDKTALAYTVEWNSTDKTYDVKLLDLNGKQFADFKMVCKYDNGKQELRFYNDKHKNRWNYVCAKIKEAKEIGYDSFTVSMIVTDVYYELKYGSDYK